MLKLGSNAPSCHTRSHSCPSRSARGGAPHRVAAAAASAEAAPPAAGRSGADLSALIEASFQAIFTGPLAAPRVLDSFRRLKAGDEYVHQWPGLGLQRAESYIAGLTAHPYPDAHGGAYPWLVAVEQSAAVIQEEFARVTADAARLAACGNNVWVPAVREDASAYGPEWRTLVLQDRGSWEPVNGGLFPRTKKVFTDLGGASSALAYSYIAHHSVTGWLFGSLIA